MQGMEELARAKVNLFLRVLRRREDGFHEIETCMAPITLCDSLEIEPANEFEFHCDEPALVGEDNLVVRATRLFFSETNREPKVRFTLRKKSRMALGWAAEVVTRPQPCAGSIASSMPGFRVNN